MASRHSLTAMAVAALLSTAAPAFAQDIVRLNPNTATAEELGNIEGLDPTLADAIVAQRPFATVLQFDALVRQTVPADQTSALYEQIFVPINLNSATPQEIALIPGMSQRMIREFLEYRPYADITVFNREIGKYVSSEEVARLRSYVTL